ncbi:UDP-N-acetyl glucosamine 2-epimerase [Actinoplanes lobatus]|uniref:UDP-N-acetylglucosamine 2-epimerase (non-hydrolyzing) n=1 Tax=Actinoplanes lobatus TaxID=113568 RepID=A0A7W7HBS2_9ACTN|nr:UDP-N-acetylglucosamine 2-epimerase (non-hydrolyzing) [Actinoplanes lobatus]MBB4747620.1 UDP-N-acetylglucosamine 2-epimerase (non-hydrolyzing) [Actinoplanes lobatus]GGN73844.1 UDP-N-acetyl glucosamine 2-epimerase [Actinoplanes lobatus]GIE39818.1 UDP-N-acetyl glucosamine 2-epimerase [Actinoplanes lobatus]
MSRREAHLVGGTHPEAVRLAPVALAMRAAGLLEPVLLAAGEHATTVTGALAAFGLEPDITLQAEPSAGGRAEALTAMVRELDELWSVRTPAAVLVQGDTTTSMAGALAAFWRRIPVVHLGSGLRSGDLESPFPEEGDRRLVAQVSALHLAPTPLAAMNLLDERIPARDVLITGDTVVDATLALAGRKQPFENPDVAAARATGTNRLILVTARCHDRILAAVRELIGRYPDIDVILPGHPDPAVRSQVDTVLAGVDRVTVTGPLSYPDLSRLLSEAYLLLTDSGGPLEEAPSFGVPALVLRDGTERVESPHTDCAKPVGPDTALIVSEASTLLDSRFRRDAMTAGGNPYGDGLAARRTAQATAALLGLAPVPEAMPVTPHIPDAILNG